MPLVNPSSPVPSQGKIINFREAKSFALAESRAEESFAAQLPILKTMSERMVATSASVLSRYWSKFVDSIGDSELWVNDIEQITMSFCSFLRQNAGDKSVLAKQVDQKGFESDVLLYVGIKVFRGKLEQNSFFNEKARFMACLHFITPEIRANTHSGIARSLKYFSSQRENFEGLTDEQFEQLRVDFQEHLKQLPEQVSESLLSDIKQIYDGFRKL